MKMLKLGALAIIALVTGTNAFSTEHKTDNKKGIQYWVIATTTGGLNYQVTTSILGTCDQNPAHACQGTSTVAPSGGLIAISKFHVTQHRSN